MMKWYYASAWGVLALVLAAGVTWSQTEDIEEQMTFVHHGYITQEGRPYDGFLQMRFEMYFDGALGLEELEKVEIEDGYYSVVIGDSEGSRGLQDFLIKSRKAELLVVVIDREDREYPLEPPQVIRSAPMALKVVGEAIASSNLKNESVTDRVLADRSVSSAKLASRSVLESHIGDDAVTRRSIANDAVGPAQIDDGSLRPSHFIPGSLSGELIADNQIESNHIKNGTITHDDLQSTAGLVLPSQIYLAETGPYQVTSNGARIAEASCNPGDILLSGGCIAGISLQINAARIRHRTAAEHVYQCQYYNAGQTTAEFSVQALCLRTQGAP